MPAYIDFGIEVQLVAKIFDVTCENTIWCSAATATPTDLDLTNACNAIATVVSANLTNWTVDTTFVEVTATDRSSATGGTQSFSMTGVTGSTVGSSLPASAAVTVTIQTGLAGRSYRGRNYMFGLGVSMYGSDINHVSGAYVSNVDSLYASYAETLGTSTLVFCVYSRRLGILTPIQNFRTNNVILARDSRVAGVGI
jgi:hypothetical protein